MLTQETTTRRVVAAFAAVVVLILLLDWPGGDGVRPGDAATDTPPAAPPTQQAAQPAPKPRPIPLRKLVGQRILVGFDGTAPSAGLLRRARRGEIGGVILFTENISTRQQVRRLTARLQRAAAKGGNPPLLIATDQEGGQVRRFVSGAPASSAAAIGRAGRTSGARRSGRVTARVLSSVGVNLDFAPVVDIGRPGGFIATQERAYGSDARTVARYADAFSHGLRDGGVWATAKHFPGLGSAAVNTDDRPATLPVSRATFESDIAPYRKLIESGVEVVMMSMASYPTIDPSGRPAAMSPFMYSVLRRDLGFTGLTITDSLAAPTGLSAPKVAQRAALAGADILLYPDASQIGFSTLMRAARKGRLSRESLTSTYTRIVEAKRTLRPRQDR